MMTLVLYTFSGTGTTRYVADRMGQEFTRLGWNVDFRDLEALVKAGSGPQELRADLVGIGCPIYGFGVPLLVKKALSWLPRVDRVPTFVFRTAGGVAPINYQASKPLIRTLRSKGYAVFYERIFSIASNWFKAFDPSVVARLVAATEKKVKLTCGELLEGKPRFLKLGWGTALGLEVLMGIEGPLLRTFGPAFHVGDGCSHCGLCVKSCPMGNIRDTKGKIRFGLNCTSCLRCLYSCPKRALTLGIYSALPIPEGFHLARTLAEAATSVPGCSCGEPPFLRRYETDDSY